MFVLYYKLSLKKVKFTRQSCLVSKSLSYIYSIRRRRRCQAPLRPFPVCVIIIGLFRGDFISMVQAEMRKELAENIVTAQTGEIAAAVAGPGAAPIETPVSALTTLLGVQETNGHCPLTVRLLLPNSRKRGREDQPGATEPEAVEEPEI